MPIDESVVDGVQKINVIDWFLKTKIRIDVENNYNLFLFLSYKLYSEYSSNMIKEVLKYSILSLAILVVGLFNSDSLFSNELLLYGFIVLHIVVIAIGTYLFYKKNSNDEKRVAKSIIFFLITESLTWVLFFVIFNLVWIFSNKK